MRSGPRPLLEVAAGLALGFRAAGICKGSMTFCRIESGAFMSIKMEYHQHHHHQHHSHHQYQLPILLLITVVCSCFSINLIVSSATQEGHTALQLDSQIMEVSRGPGLLLRFALGRSPAPPRTKPDGDSLLLNHEYYLKKYWLS